VCLGGFVAVRDRAITEWCFPLILRTRTKMTGGIWSIIHPGVFVMERGMLLGIKDRAEAIAGSITHLEQIKSRLCSLFLPREVIQPGTSFQQLLQGD
jgi:hypothetical protein